MDKALGLLGITKKAGKLAIGSEASAISARQGKAYLIVTATDASSGTVRRAEANAIAAGSEHIRIPYSKFDIGNITGRGSPGVVAILDKGLAESFKLKLTEETSKAIDTKELRIGKEGDA